MFLLLSAWLPSDIVTNTIFGGVNMLRDESLINTFLALVGCSGGNKPFDCVGTANEARAAVHLTAIRCGNEYLKDSGKITIEQIIDPITEENIQVSMNASNKAIDFSLPVVLCTLCKSVGIDLIKCNAECCGPFPEVRTYEEVQRRWGLE
jgi:hypothetical protein